MGQPTDPQADEITNGAPSTYVGGAKGFDPDAVLTYLVGQGVPIEQAQTLSKSLRGGAQDDLGIQGSAAAAVADREVGRLKAVTRYLDLEKKAVTGAKLPPQDEAFVAAVRNRHRELIQQRAMMAQQDQQNNERNNARERQQVTAPGGRMNALQGQQLEKVGEREQNRLYNMEAYAQDPGARQLAPDGSRATWVPDGKATGEPAINQAPAMQRAMQQVMQQAQQRTMAHAKTAAAIAQQFGVPPDAAAQLAADLHAIPTQPQQGGQGAPARGDGGANSVNFTGLMPASIGGGI